MGEEQLEEQRGLCGRRREGREGESGRRWVQIMHVYGGRGGAGFVEHTCMGIGKRYRAIGNLKNFDLYLEIESH